MAYSSSSSSSSVISGASSPVSNPSLNPQRRRHVYVMPANSNKPRKAKQQPPQDIIDEFWAKFTTKTPGKATTVIPQNEYAEKVARRSAAATGVNTQTSYDEAAAVCKTKVDKIVKECRRVNQKYRDPHFDLEFDLKFNRRDCLESLWNTKDKDPTPSSFSPKAVKRVVDIFDNPQFYIDGPTANDVRQGRDGDCWLMAALCNLSNKTGLIEKVCVAHDQDVGVYGFVFHRDGEWYSEIIDDKLYLTKPDYDEGYIERILWEDRERVNSEEAYRRIYQTNSGALYFAQCENPNETWLPLLEKAYAKAHGDYACIEGGFTGEAIEDLTGGVTSEIYTSDILDKEYFWKEKLLKVNEDCLLGCSTGFATKGWGERKGIIEMHAYSVMKAVEMDNERLVLLKNPWGKGEWRGAWSDGSKEWTPDWLQKLNHKFGDDGAFWISYHDLLKKYNIFDITRLFDHDWKVTSIWTTLSVPWTLDYHDTHFAFELSKTGPVVLVLAQLDDRYFRGLEGQYRFELQFRLHKAGQEDYVVRSAASYRMNRSVNVELDLEAGSYEIRVRIDALRYSNILPIEQVIRNNAKGRREKLTRIGLAYDLAHSKGRVVESAEEKAAREAQEKKQRETNRAEIKRKIQKDREQEHYLRTQAMKRNLKKIAKRNARREAKVDKMKAAQAKNRSGPDIPSDAESSRGRPARGKPSIKKHVKIQDLEYATEHLSISNGKKHETANTGPAETDNSGAADKPPTEPGNQDGAKPPVDKSVKLSVAVPDDSQKTKEHTTEEVQMSPMDTRSVTGSVRSNGDEAAPKESDEARSEPTAPSEVLESRLCESDDDDYSSISSLYEPSDREWEIEIDAVEARTSSPARVPPSNSAVNVDDQDEFEKDPWNAVVVVGLRVYHKVPEDDKDNDTIVKLRVVPPNPYAEEAASSNNAESSSNITKGLDVDDSAKDATLEGEIKQRKKSIAPTSEDLRDASILVRSELGGRSLGVPGADSLGKPRTKLRT
ncbi:calpain-like protein [Colletotrichum karsti]|uniref:Calpain-like protein n=1 Tax=Colletotrichum karsti TaxID=1095194 RepID=A0A9P6IGD8_9PEZI|nr:calpain-like protein [Colletotrichum karsti]KAF9882424.1 calpain-like protein [Colletotrichum karsti]